MDANNVKKQAFEIANRLISLDPVEYDSAINQYFDANAVLDHKAIYLSGASRIKKIAYLQSLLGHESKLDQEPVYNDRDNTLAIHFRRVYQTPVIPRFIPLAGALSARRLTLHYAANLHLMPDGSNDEDGGDKLYVTRVSDLARQQQFPLENFVPFFLIRPVITFLALLAANVAFFFDHHRRESPPRLILSAITELFGAFWGLLLAEKGKRQAQADYWRAEKGAQVDRLYEQARSKASFTLNDIQYRAKKAGVPLEQYKTQLASIYDNATHLAEKNLSRIEQRARSAGVPLEEYKKQAGALYAQAVSVANEGFKELEERAKAMGVPVEEYRKMVENAVEEVRKHASLGIDNAREHANDAMRDVDQEANHASSKKSHSQAEQSSQQQQHQKKTGGNGNANGNRNKSKGNNAQVNGGKKNKNSPPAQHDDLHNDVPEGARTPLGGHDPLAPDAPSYAEAVAEE